MFSASDSLEKQTRDQAVMQVAIGWARTVCPAGVVHRMHAFTDLQRAQIEAEPRSKRQLEFAIGRECAHAALNEMDEFEIVGVSKNRSPQWPAGFVGSISHSDIGVWSAAVPAKDLVSIGIDTERVVESSVQMQLAKEIATANEWKLTAAAEYDRETVFTIVFSAKESFYKCWSHLTGEFFGFQQAVVESMDHEKISIRMTPCNPNRGQQPDAIDVQYLVDGADIFTATWIKNSNCDS